MSRIVLLLLGAFATVTFAAVLLVGIPALRYNVLPIETVVPRYTPQQLRGRDIYIANGCYFCHSQQIRDPAITTDTERNWGRQTYPSDYVHDRPALLGTMRTGPDLINVGERLPDPQWHLIHLYQPRAVVPWSIMPPMPFLFEIKSQAEEGETTIAVPAPYGPTDGVVVPTQDALDLVAYLLSLRRSFQPPELRIAGGVDAGR